MGFCLHNHDAVAASTARAVGAKKVLILDWDVHHGNDTQEEYEHNKTVLYISLHRHEGGKFYPGTGGGHEVGSMGGEGLCVTVPWSREGVDDYNYIFASEHVVIPIAREFAPNFTIICIGFDAARGDPLGCFNGWNALRCTMCRGTWKVMYQVKNYTLRSGEKAIAEAIIDAILKTEQSSCIFPPPWILMFHCLPKTMTHVTNPE